MNLKERLFRDAAAAAAKQDFETAAACYRRLVETIDDADFWGWNNLGHTLHQLRQPAEAVRSFRKAASINPQSPDVWLSLGHTLSAVGDGAGARLAFYRCLSLDLAVAANNRGLLEFLAGFVGAGNFLPELDPETLRPRLPGIFVASLPKSGTVFLQEALCKGLGKRPVAVPSGGLFPQVTIAQSAIEKLHETGGIYIIHCAPSAYNRREVSHRLERLIVHLRDPRQALLSWAHFLPQVIRNVDPVLRYHYTLPADYDSLPFESQLDWQIEHHLPHIVAFIAGWMEFADDRACGVRVMFTTHEQLAQDQDAFFRRLLLFHDIPESEFAFPERPQVGSMNYRSGNTQEWQRVFTPEQAVKATRAIPSDLLDRFGWR